MATNQEVRKVDRLSPTTLIKGAKLVEASAEVLIIKTHGNIALAQRLHDMLVEHLNIIVRNWISS